MRFISAPPREWCLALPCTTCSRSIPVSAKTLLARMFCIRRLAEYHYYAECLRCHTEVIVPEMLIPADIKLAVDQRVAETGPGGAGKAAPPIAVA